MPAQAPDVSSVSGLEFTHTAEYRKEFSKAVSDAKAFCKQYLAEHPGARNLAIISDIDETLLDNREQFQNHDKFVWDEFETWIRQARSPLLKETAEFLSWARKNGFAVFLVTGRPERDRLYTIENLVSHGVSYDGLYLRPERSDEPAEFYKTPTRKSIEDKGFTIVANIGDQWSDLVGGSSLDCEKLPNKIYFIK